MTITVRRLTLGRAKLPTLLDTFTEQLGATLTPVGGSVPPGDRRPRLMPAVIPIHGDPTDSDPLAVARRQRRQLTSLMQNHVYRSQPIYWQFEGDPEVNGWLALGEGDLIHKEGGYTMGEWQLSLGQAFRLGARSTHRPALTVNARDLRDSGQARDTLRRVRSTDFATLTPLSLTYLPTGAYDAADQAGNRKASSPVAGALGLNITSYEQSEADINKGDVVIFDRRGNTTANPTP